MTPKRPRPVQRRMERFLDEPASIRNAMSVLIVAIFVSALGGGVVVWIFDPHDFDNLGDSLWWALQTVTTVGYGDITPTTPLGRMVGAAIMVESVVFLSMLTALISSSFIERLRHQLAPMDPIQHRLEDILHRLENIEAALQARDASPGGKP